MPTEIGRGQYAWVYHGITSTLEQLAVKVYFAEDKVFNGQYQEALKCATVEGLAVGLKHQNVNSVTKFQPDAIMQLYTGRKRRCAYLVYEMMPYGSFGDKFTFGCKLNEQVCRFYFKQLISGLQYIHSRGFVHGDIRPDNLMIDKEGNLRISDFRSMSKYDDQDD